MQLSFVASSTSFQVESAMNPPGIEISVVACVGVAMHEMHNRISATAAVNGSHAMVQGNGVTTRADFARLDQALSQSFQVVIGSSSLNTKYVESCLQGLGLFDSSREFLYAEA
eukprot:m.376704 g.376704  ORF g.376704 m.376704 type:complete len:113 (+) comp84096_c0_seq1:170-508(+)